MGFEELQEEILRKGNEEVKKIKESALSEAEEMIKSAKEEREKLLEKTSEEVMEIIKRERDERIAGAKLEAKKILAEARESVINEVIDRTWEKLKEFRKEEGYKEVLKRLICEGLKEVGGNGIVYVAEADRKLAEEILTGKKAILAEESINGIGGALIYSLDKRMCVNNTYEAIFEEKKEKIRRMVFDMVFK